MSFWRKEKLPVEPQSASEVGAVMTFLKQLERKIQSDEGMHHSIRLAQYGNDSDGWRDELMVEVLHSGTVHTLFLGGADLANPAATVAEIQRLIGMEAE